MAVYSALISDMKRTGQIYPLQGHCSTLGPEVQNLCLELDPPEVYAFFWVKSRGLRPKRKKQTQQSYTLIFFVPIWFALCKAGRFIVTLPIHWIGWERKKAKVCHFR